MCDGTREMTRQELVDQINELSVLNAQAEAEKQMLKQVIDEVKKANAQLKEALQNLKEKYETPVCEGGIKKKCTDCEEYGFYLQELIEEMEDQHQQDCIRYNDMRTAFLKTVDELSMLRKQFGVGQ